MMMMVVMYQVTSYLRLLALSMNVQPEYELSSSTRFGQFQKFGKIEFGVLSTPAIP